MSKSKSTPFFGETSDVNKALPDVIELHLTIAQWILFLDNGRLMGVPDSSGGHLVLLLGLLGERGIENDGGGKQNRFGMDIADAILRTSERAHRTMVHTLP